MRPASSITAPNLGSSQTSGTRHTTVSPRKGAGNAPGQSGIGPATRPPASDPGFREEHSRRPHLGPAPGAGGGAVRSPDHSRSGPSVGDYLQRRLSRPAAAHASTRLSTTTPTSGTVLQPSRLYSIGAAGALRSMRLVVSLIASLSTSSAASPWPRHPTPLRLTRPCSRPPSQPLRHRRPLPRSQSWSRPLGPSSLCPGQGLIRFTTLQVASFGGDGAAYVDTIRMSTAAMTPPRRGLAQSGICGGANSQGFDLAYERNWPRRSAWTPGADLRRHPHPVSAC